ncbi:histidine kinase HHK3 [Penicillium vulpinum]|uniref:histidine kinase n=1 Tax=Penicillium vulpinum TaxID=29845 RepID=A0A1V6RI93_9EURO|nr:histidine kinase HHK3 [Penicillium vulpinum]KAJ5972555.1 histidine kinase HHK3 [Penicillium vulpinum]OQE01204.1 hypothetical protein PENVUL_c044G08330 [Penicillium vulpinum]
MATPSGAERVPYFPKANALILLSKHGPLPLRPKTVGPIYDPQNFDRPIESWSEETEASCYPLKEEHFAPSEIPPRPVSHSNKYLRPYLAKNERLRLSLLWYHTRDTLNDSEFLSGLQEKACFAQESTGWEFAVIGIQDLNYYIRLATVGLQLGILPRGETICAHTVTQAPSSVFLLPDLVEDWRFQNSPYLEHGGLRGYAGVPLRLQHESGECVSLGSLCVASSKGEEPLTKSQQMTLVRLADWIVSDIVKCASAVRQRERQRMNDLIAMIQDESDDLVPEKPVLKILRIMYPDADISLQSSKTTHIEIGGRDPIPVSEIKNGLWEDTEYIDDFIANSNNQEFPSTRVVRASTAQCENISGPSFLVVGSKSFQLVFDDIDSWFIQSCADIISKMWHKHILAEVVETKEKFLRGFSHQLRTPLHGIIGSVELLAEELGLNASNSSTYPSSSLLGMNSGLNPRGPFAHLDIIKTAGQDLVSIVNSMITLNRWADIAMRDRHHSTHTILELESDLANQILKLFSADLRYTASIFFNHDLPSNCDTIQIDLELLRDSLMPLIINAIQNTPGGIVTVTISILLEYKQLVIDVVDTGCGIHPEHQERIFEPYEKVSAHSTGAGLGLTLSSKFARLLHGSVNLVYSDLNNGSHFRATFREVEHFLSTLSSQPLAVNLHNLPPKFYNMTFDWDNPSLSNIFSEYLTHNNFICSNNMEDCFAILDFVPDVEKHRVSLSQFPTNQVIICLVPASENHTCSDSTLNNVVYVKGPFLTSTMTSALEEADRLLPSLKSPQESLVQTFRHSLILDQINKDPNLDQGTVSTTSSPSPKGWSSQPPTNNSVASISDASLSSMHRAERSDSIVSKPITQPSSPLTAPHQPTALLVDDNAINLRILQMYCKKRGLPYYCATDGLQAVNTFSQHQSSPVAVGRAAIELIIMDLQMPVCGGIEATQQIRLLEKQNNWRECVLFIVTGQDSPADRIAAEAVGADEYFVKPVSIKLLDRSIKKYFDSFEVR